MAFTNITITGTYKKPGGAVASGWVSLIPTSVLINGTDIRAPIPTWVALDGTGTISQAVVATDDAGTTPAGVTYAVTELINNTSPKTYNITVPSGSPGQTLDLSAVIPVTNIATGMADGTLALPAIRWLTEQTLGFYRAAAGVIGIAGNILLNGWADFVNRIAPATPAAGRVRVYSSTADKRLHQINDAGTDASVGPYFGAIVANDYAGANIGEKIVAADLSLGVNPGEIWAYGGGDFGIGQKIINNNHHVRLGPGTYQCSTNVSSLDPLSRQWLLGDYVSFRGVGFATVIRENPYFDPAQPNYPASFCTSTLNVNPIGIQVSDLKYLGSNPRGTAASTSFNFGNGRNCRITNVFFYQTNAFCVQFGGNSGREQQFTISGASNATPIVITTSTSNAYYDGLKVEVINVLGNTAANGFWRIGRVLDSTHFTLDTSVGNGAWTSGGTVYARPASDGCTMDNCIFMDIRVQNFGVVNSKNSHVYNNIVIRPGGAANDSLVNTNGTAVTWVTGNQFLGFISGTVFKINGVSYTTTGTPTATTLTLTVSAGVQTNAYLVPQVGAAAAFDFEMNTPDDVMENWNCSFNLFDYRGVGAKSVASVAIQVSYNTALLYAGSGPGMCVGNEIIGRDEDIQPAASGYLLGIAMVIVGRDIIISENTIRGTGGGGCLITGIRNKFTNNHLYSIGPAYTIRFNNCTSCQCTGNDGTGVILEDGTSGNNVYDNPGGTFTYSGLSATSRVVSQTATAVWNPGNVLNGGFTSTTVTVTPARIGDRVNVGFNVAVPAGVWLFGAITAANTVTASLLNMSGAAVNLGSGTLTVEVRQ